MPLPVPWPRMRKASRTASTDQPPIRTLYRETSLPSQTSLIVSDPGPIGRFFNGGYVLVPAKNGLFTDEFTIEAWILPGFAAGSEHTLFDAGGHYRAPFDSSADFHGFRIYATAARSWQVSLSPGGNVFTAPLLPPLIPPGGRAAPISPSPSRT